METKTKKRKASELDLGLVYQWKYELYYAKLSFPNWSRANIELEMPFQTDNPEPDVNVV